MMLWSCIEGFFFQTKHSILFKITVLLIKNFNTGNLTDVAQNKYYNKRLEYIGQLMPLFSPSIKLIL